MLTTSAGLGPAASVPSGYSFIAAGTAERTIVVQIPRDSVMSTCNRVTVILRPIAVGNTQKYRVARDGSGFVSLPYSDGNGGVQSPACR